MATNFYGKGGVITVVSPVGGVSSGDPVLIGTLFGVATHDAAAGAALELAITGEWDLPKDTNLVISQGDALYWDSVNGWLDKTDAAQFGVARATAGALQAATTVRCVLGTVPHV